MDKTDTTAAAQNDVVNFTPLFGSDELKLQTTPKAVTPFAGMGIGTTSYRNRLQVPQRIGWENLSVNGTGNGTLSALATFGINDPNLENITTSMEIGLLQAEASNGDTGQTTAIQNAVKNNFHNLTVFSRSLLTDTALGGLKKDLTVFFEGSGSGLSGAIPNRTLYDPNDPPFRRNIQ